MEGLNRALTKSSYVAAAMHPVLAASTGTDVNRSPLTGTSAVLKVEDAMKQSGTKISSSVSASLLAHLNSPEAFLCCAAVSVVVPGGRHTSGRSVHLLGLPSAVLPNML